jgi:hypothetical protein
MRKKNMQWSRAHEKLRFFLSFSKAKVFRKKLYLRKGCNRQYVLQHGLPWHPEKDAARKDVLSGFCVTNKGLDTQSART